MTPLSAVLCARSMVPLLHGHVLPRVLVLLVALLLLEEEGMMPLRATTADQVEEDAKLRVSRPSDMSNIDSTVHLQLFGRATHTPLTSASAELCGVEQRPAAPRGGAVPPVDPPHAAEPEDPLLAHRPIRHAGPLRRRAPSPLLPPPPLRLPAAPASRARAAAHLPPAHQEAHAALLAPAPSRRPEPHGVRGPAQQRPGAAVQGAHLQACPAAAVPGGRAAVPAPLRAGADAHEGRA